MTIPIEAQKRFGEAHRVYRDRCKVMQKINVWFRGLKGEQTETQQLAYDIAKVRFSRESKEYKAEEQLFQSYRISEIEQEKIEKHITGEINTEAIAAQLPGPPAKELERLENLDWLLHSDSAMGKLARKLLAEDDMKIEIKDEDKESERLMKLSRKELMEAIPDETPFEN